MFDLFLQVWGGLFYFLNKLFFSLAERSLNIKIQYKWMGFAWGVYLAGLPAWVIIFLSEHNWIAAAVKSSGVPAMLMGLYTSVKNNKSDGTHVLLDRISKLMIVAGGGLSLYDFGGITTFNQILELGIAFGFIFGTYFLAVLKPYGYLWFFIGNLCAGHLMMSQGYYLLMFQQFLSGILVLYAFWLRKKE